MSKVFTMIYSFFMYIITFSVVKIGSNISFNPGIQFFLKQKVILQSIDVNILI